MDTLIVKQDAPQSALLDALRIEFRASTAVAAAWRAAYQQRIRNCRCAPEMVEVRILIDPGEDDSTPHTCDRCRRQVKYRFEKMPIPEAIPWLAAEAERSWLKNDRLKDDDDRISGIGFGEEELQQALALDGLEVNSTLILERACRRALAELRRKAAAKDPK